MNHELLALLTMAILLYYTEGATIGVQKKDGNIPHRPVYFKDTVAKSLNKNIWDKYWTSRKLKSFQYNAALAITGAIKGTSSAKIYQKLELYHFEIRDDSESSIL